MTHRGHTKNSGVSMHTECTVVIDTSGPSDYDREVARGWRKIHANRTPEKMLVHAWRSSARCRSKTVTLPTAPFDFRSDDQ
jgi:hypothetical protein